MSNKKRNAQSRARQSRAAATQTSHTKPIIGGLVALALAGALTVTAGIGSSWFTNPELKTWFNGWGKGVESAAPDNTDKPDNSGGGENDGDNNGGNTDNSDNTDNPDNTDKKPAEGDGKTILSDITDGHGISLYGALIPVEEYAEYGISRSAASAYTVTATLNPEETTETELVWSVAWGNNSLNWGSETKGAVTDYVTLSPNGLTATVTLKKAFGTQIILTAASKNYRDVSASATFDYIQRAAISDIAASDSNAILLNMGGGASDYTIMPSFGVGTVTGVLEIQSASVQFTNAVWYEHEQSYVAAKKAYESMYSGCTFSFRTSAVSKSVTVKNEMKGSFTFDYSDFFTGSGAPVQSASSTCKANMQAYLVTVSRYTSVTNWGTVTLKGRYTYGDYYSSEVTCTIGIRGWNTNSLSVAPTDVTFDGNSFYF